MASTRLFEEFGSNEDDTISITSTNNADEDGKEYPVECILAEARDKRGRVKEYLVKWAGWPLSGATWEPPEHFEAEEIIEQWQAHQRAVEHGEAELFDVQLWHDACIQADDEKEVRHARRRAKRKKLGLPVESSPQPTSSSMQDSSVAPPGRSDSSDSEPIRTKPPARRRRQITAIDSDDEEPIIKSKQRRTQLQPSGRKQYVAKATERRTNAHPEKPKSTLTSLLDTGPVERRSSYAAQAPDDESPVGSSAILPPRASPERTRRNSDMPAVPARLTATAKEPMRTANIKRPVNIYPETKKTAVPVKRGAKRSATSTRQLPHGEKFRNLSTANRYHKAVENRAPDLSSLTMIDPATGKTQAAVPVAPRSPRTREEVLSKPIERLLSPGLSHDQAKPSKPAAPVGVTTGPSLKSAPQTPGGRTEPTNPSANKLPSAFSRRSPKAIRPERTPSPPHPPRNPLYAFPSDIPDLWNRKNWTCYFWGTHRHCNKIADECEFAHGPAPYRCAKPSREGRDDIEGLMKREVASYLERRQRELEDNVDPLSQAPIAPSRRRSLGFDAAPPVNPSEGTTSLASNAALSLATRQFATSSNAHLPAMFRRVTAPSEVQNVRTDSPQRRASVAVSPLNLSRVPSPAQNAPLRVPDHSNITMNVQAGLQNFHLNVRLVTSNEKQLKDLLQPTGEQFHVNLSFNHMVVAADLEKAYPGFTAQCAAYPGGNIVPDQASLDRMRQLACLARHRVAAFVSFHDKFTLFCYQHGEEWKPLDDAAQPPSASAPLRFRFGPAVDKVPLAEGPPLYSLLNLDEARLFPDKDGAKRKNRCVMLILPPDRQQESLVLAHYLKEIGSEVFHVDTPGAWHFFNRNGEYLKVIIIDPDVRLHEIHHLSQFLRLTGGNGAMFSWGVNTRIQRLQQRAPSFSCERLFPRGEVVFITDEVILHHPEQATQLIRRLMQHKARDRNAHKIATRPGLKDWLIQLISTPDLVSTLRNKELAELYHAVCKLCPLEAEDALFPGNPSETADLVSERLEEFTNAEWWQVREFAGQDIRSTEYMVEWFAGWSALIASHRYRTFVVVHVEKDRKAVFNQQTKAVEKHYEIDPHGWGKKWQHLFVTNPAGVMAMWSAK